MRDAVGSDGLDRLRGLKSELLTNNVGMSSSPRGFFEVLLLRLWFRHSDRSEEFDSDEGWI